MYKEVEDALGGNCELVQVGQQSGKYFQRCLEYEKKLGIKTSRYVDLLRHGELNTLYNQAWLFVTSAFFETFSNSHMEAAACGLPTLSWHIGSLPEVVKHKKTGLLIRPINEKQFVESWLDLAKNNERRNEMGDAGPAWSTEFTWDKICDSIEMHLEFK
jgi:glycosyltransferase involved in cell wall biosynthesis